MQICERGQALVRTHTAAACFGRRSRDRFVDIGLNLNDEIRKNMGVVNVGDVKNFTLEVQILAGFEAPAVSNSAVEPTAAPA